MRHHRAIESQPRICFHAFAPPTLAAGGKSLASFKDHPMNTRRLISSLALLLAASAAVHAEEPSTDILNFISYRTRAEVRAELFAYKKSGVNPWATSYNQLKSFHSQATRDEVLAELFAFREEACLLYAEDSGSAYLSRLGLPGGAAVYAGLPSAESRVGGAAVRMPPPRRGHATGASS
jgi:hypothetical protein